MPANSASPFPPILPHDRRLCRHQLFDKLLHGIGFVHWCPEWYDVEVRTFAQVSPTWVDSQGPQKASYLYNKYGAAVLSAPTLDARNVSAAALQAAIWTVLHGRDNFAVAEGTGLQQDVYLLWSDYLNDFVEDPNCKISPLTGPG